MKSTALFTHIRKLNTVEAPLANFFASGVLHRRAKLGPFLWQLPPTLGYNDERLEEFFTLLPLTMGDAVRLTKKADRVDPDFPSSAKNSKQPLIHAIEVRHHSFENPDFISILRKHGIALMFADTVGTWLGGTFWWGCQ